MNWRYLFLIAIQLGILLNVTNAAADRYEKTKNVKSKYKLFKNPALSVAKSRQIDDNRLSPAVLQTLLGYREPLNSGSNWAGYWTPTPTTTDYYTATSPTTTTPSAPTTTSPYTTEEYPPSTYTRQPPTKKKDKKNNKNDRNDKDIKKKKKNNNNKNKHDHKDNDNDADDDDNDHEDDDDISENVLHHQRANFHHHIQKRKNLSENNKKDVQKPNIKQIVNSDSPRALRTHHRTEPERKQLQQQREQQQQQHEQNRKQARKNGNGKRRAGKQEFVQRKRHLLNNFERRSFRNY